MKRIIVLGLLSFALSSYNCTFGQSYNYGGGRVVNQGQIGLPQPSSSYIGSGTLSKSAQGAVETGAQANPALPKVNSGGFIGTPGDNMYSSKPIRAQELKRIRPAQPQTRIIYVREPAKPVGQTYVPDKNVPLEYSNFPVEPLAKDESAAPVSPEPSAK